MNLIEKIEQEEIARLSANKVLPAELPLNTTPAEAATSPEPISSGNPG